MSFDFPIIDTGIDTTNEAALCVITSFYVIAALFNRHIPDTGAVYENKNVIHSVYCAISHCSIKLWKDKLGQISLAVTTLFWGAGAVLQLLVLEWARVNLNMPLREVPELQGVFAFGIASGALLAAKFIPLKRSLECNETWCSDGSGCHLDGLRQKRLAGLPLADIDWWLWPVFRSANERLAPTSRPCADECWTFNRRSEFQ